MTLPEAIRLFGNLGVHVPSLDRREFHAAYCELAKRYHPDRNTRTSELMANINAARTVILKEHRWTVSLRA